MNIALAQIKAEKNIYKNYRKHLKMVHKALRAKAELVLFPELSLSSYAPSLAHTFIKQRYSLRPFQSLCNKHNIIIGIGLPTKGPKGLEISLVFLRPWQKPLKYSKKHLFIDEKAFFTKSTDKTFFLKLKRRRLALSICYELSCQSHTQTLMSYKPALYLSSVAKDKVSTAHEQLQTIAKTYKLPALMVNCVGEQEGFCAKGSSVAFSKNGKRLALLTEKEEGLLLFQNKKATTIR